MTTRGDLRDLCRRRLADEIEPVNWSDLQINQWVIDAIADYSNFFPRTLTKDITLSAGTHEYPFEGMTGVRSILRIEYPKSQDPKVYLERRDIRSPAGWHGKAVYDVLGDPPAILVLGPGNWATGAKTAVTYLADHDYPDDDADAITVPDLHIELLVLFVRMAALQEAHHKETRNPMTNVLLVGTLSLDASRAEREYRTKIEQFLAAWQPGSGMVSWGDDIGRVY